MKFCQISLVFSLILFITCKKEEQSFTEVSGTVYDRGTNRTITAANAQVFFEWRLPWTYGAEKFHLDSTLTDAQGRYSVSAETPDEDLHVYGTSHQHYPGGDLGMMPNVQRGRKQTLNLDLIPFAWVRMNITKTGLFDFVNFGPATGSTRTFTAYSDTVLIAKAFGNIDASIMAFRYHNNVVNLKNYRTQTIGRDTVDIYVEF
jgi:hypothetical protein